MNGIHVMKDTELGGIEREYAEVKRKANVGERIRVFGHCAEEANGVFTVENTDDTYGAGYAGYTVNGANGYGTPFFGGKAYVVIEPTDVMCINGVRYRLVERKVAVGERVIVVNADNDAEDYGSYKNGHVAEVLEIRHDDHFVGEYVMLTSSDGRAFRLYASEYRVLEPVESAAPAPASPDVLGLIANLSVRLTAAEREIAELKRKDAPTTDTARQIAEGIAKLSGATRKKPSRDEIIERAKADVTELKRTYRHVPFSDTSFWPQVDGEKTETEWIPMQRVEFVINREKRTVVALIRYLDGGEIYARGIAKCAPGDVFNTHIGRAIALRRALGLDIPDEYVNSPAPTDVKAGDIIEYDGWIQNGRKVTKKLRIADDSLIIGVTVHSDSIAAKKGRVIDDSREETEVSV
jgi:hypothetical protein